MSFVRQEAERILDGQVLFHAQGPKISETK